MQKLDSNSWSSTWRHPAETSMGEICPNGYDGPFREFWKQQLEFSCNNIVDLACGNGALTWLCNDLLNAEATVTDITGVDFADISPFEVLDRNPQDFPAVHFIGNTRLEHLPLATASIDLAVSQYGLEYSNLDKSIPEIARILTPQGRMAFILHDRDGFLVRGATKPLQNYKMILQDVPAHEIILRLASLCRAKHASHENPTLTPEYQGLLAELDETSRVFTSLYEENPDIKPMLVYKEKLNRAFQEACKAGQGEPFDLEAFIADAREALQQNIDRVEDLSSAALDNPGRRQLVAMIEQHGFEVTQMQTIRYKQNEVWGTALAASRRT